MLERERRLIHIAQRDIAQQKLGFGERVTFDQPVLLDEPIGKLGIAAREESPGNRLALRPPRRRADEVVGLGEQNLDRRIGHVLLAAPAQLLEDEPRVRAQLRRNPRHDRFCFWGLRSERQARLGQQTIVGRHQRQQAARRLGLPVPQQPIDPLHMILGTQRRGMPGQKILFVEWAEIRGDPERPQRACATFEIAQVYHYLRFAELASGAHRRVAFEPIGCDRVRFAGQSLFGMFAQGFLRGPIRVLFDELGDVGKPAGSTRSGIVHPVQHLHRQRVVNPRRAGVGAGPVATQCGRKRRAHHIQIGSR